jgi:hypothetical protein
LCGQGYLAGEGGHPEAVLDLLRRDCFFEKANSLLLQLLSLQKSLHKEKPSDGAKAKIKHPPDKSLDWL